MIERHSQTWQHITEWAESELKRNSIEIESPGLDMAQTEFLRGRIAALRALLRQAADTPVVGPSAFSATY